MLLNPMSLCLVNKEGFIHKGYGFSLIQVAPVYWNICRARTPNYIISNGSRYVARDLKSVFGFPLSYLDKGQPITPLHNQCNVTLHS